MIRVFFSLARALRPTMVCLVYTLHDWPALQKHNTSNNTNVFHIESKTDPKLHCNCVWNSRYSGVPKTFLVDWRLCVACYYPHNSYRLPQHYKRQVCVPSCSCKHRYLWVSPIFEHYFCLDCRGVVRHWQPFWSSKCFLFIGLCWYFTPQWTSDQVISKHAVLVICKKCTVTKCHGS